VLQQIVTNTANEVTGKRKGRQKMNGLMKNVPKPSKIKT
jgi:hypothetical protein